MCGRTPLCVGSVIVQGHAVKRIILLSDGTGNAASRVWRTNVWRIFESLDLTGSNQVTIYDDGVGTSSFKSLAILGGAFGCSSTATTKGRPG